MKRRTRSLKIETTWLRAFARHYLPCDGAVEYVPETFRREGVDLLHFMCLLRRGRVVFADKLDGPGAYWIVEGQDCDGQDMRAGLMVSTQEMSIKVVEVERRQREQRTKIAAA